MGLFPFDEIIRCSLVLPLLVKLGVSATWQENIKASLCRMLNVDPLAEVVNVKVSTWGVICCTLSNSRAASLALNLQALPVTLALLVFPGQDSRESGQHRRGAIDRVPCSCDVDSKIMEEIKS